MRGPRKDGTALCAGNNEWTPKPYAPPTSAPTISDGVNNPPAPPEP